MFFISISILLFIPYAWLLLYYRRSWKTTPVYEPDTPQSNHMPFVSVIISARNEETKIADCLNSMAAQNYPSTLFEVIVINDHSEDNTPSIIQSFSSRFSNIRLIELKDYVKSDKLNSYKKKAIETGISLSAGELIMTTDADCIAPHDWIFTVASYYKKNQSAMIASPVNILMPIGAGGLKKFFYAFQILDFITLQGITGAALSRQFHYMANGANLAYPKSIFIEVKGFRDIDNIASGDDMLLMEKVKMIRPDKVHYLKSFESTVTTFPEQTIHSFFNQRIRWASKSSTYQDYKIKTVLALVYVINVWCILLLAASVYQHSYWHLFIFLAMKIGFELLFLFPVAKFFKHQTLLYWFAPLQPFHILYIIIAGWLGSFGSYKWKGRKVK